MQDNLFLIKGLAWVLVCLFLMVLFAEAQTPEAQTRIVTIAGRVFLPDRQPAALMPIHISNSGGYSADTTTDSGGNYQFEGVPMARIQFKVNPPVGSPYYDAPITFNITRESQTSFHANIYILPSTMELYSMDMARANAENQ